MKEKRLRDGRTYVVLAYFTDDNGKAYWEVLCEGAILRLTYEEMG